MTSLRNSDSRNESSYNNSKCVCFNLKNKKIK